MPLSLVPQWAKPLRPMEGIARKLVLLFIALSAVGWVVFVAGFGEFVKNEKADSDDYDASDNPYMYYVWAASVLGPVLFLLAILHAALWKWPSSAVGSVTALIGVGYVSAISNAMNVAGDNIRTEDHDIIKRVINNLWFAGGFLSCLFWAVVQVMWIWYPVTSTKNITKIWPFKPLTGISRKVVLPFIALSAVGWVVFVAGFVRHLQYLEINVADTGEGYYWAWAASVSGLVLHILAVVHAVLWGLPSLIVGSLTAVLGVFCVVAIGHALHLTGLAINLVNDIPFLFDGTPRSLRLLFAGSFLACFFWAVVQAMWPWYATGMETEEELAEDRQKLLKWISFKPFRPLEGIVRKGVLIFIGLSFVGWIVFVVGFGLRIKWNFDQSDDYDLGYAPDLYWGWTASIGGPVVYLLAVAHAVMWTRISSILGSVTAILGTMFISAAAYSPIRSGIIIYYDNEEKTILGFEPEVRDYDKVLCAGGVLLCLFWAVVQAMWLWYPYGSVTAIRTSCSKVKRVRILDGIARKIVFIFLALSVVGWIMFVIGFHERTEANEEIFDDFDLGDSFFLYGGWAASVVGPVVYILAVVHAVLWGLPSALIGSVAALLGIVYITGMGYGLIESGIILDNVTNLGSLGDYEKSWKLMFSGSLVATFFLGLVQATWPWYSTGLDDTSEPSPTDASHEEAELEPM